MVPETYDQSTEKMEEEIVFGNYIKKTVQSRKLNSLQKLNSIKYMIQWFL